MTTPPQQNEGQQAPLNMPMRTNAPIPGQELPFVPLDALVPDEGEDDCNAAGLHGADFFDSMRLYVVHDVFDWA